MINRLVPACINLNFCANDKLAPGEISRVKRDADAKSDSLVRSPKVDTFTSANKDALDAKISNVDNLNEKNYFKKIFEKKGKV